MTALIATIAALVLALAIVHMEATLNSGEVNPHPFSRERIIVARGPRPWIG
jgi:hypothetical protein